MVKRQTAGPEVYGLETYLRCVKSFSNKFYSQKYWLYPGSSVVTPSWHDWKIVDWDFKPPHTQHDLKITDRDIYPWHKQTKPVLLKFIYLLILKIDCYKFMEQISKY